MSGFTSTVTPFPVPLLPLHAEQEQHRSSTLSGVANSTPFCVKGKFWLKRLSIPIEATKIIFILTIYSGEEEDDVTKNLEE